MILPGFHLCKAQPRCFSSCVEGPRCLEPVPTGPGQWLPVICSYTWCGSENRGQKSPHRCASMSVGQVPTRRTARQSTAPPGCHSQPFPWPQAQGVLTPSHLPHSDRWSLAPLGLVFIRLLVLSNCRLPRWRSTWEESACQCRRHRFNPWIRRIPWRRKWQPPPVFLPGKSHGQRSLVVYSPRGFKGVWLGLAAKQQQWLMLSIFPSLFATSIFLDKVSAQIFHPILLSFCFLIICSGCKS